VGAYCLVALAHDRVPAPTFSNEVACLRIACQINTPATSLAGLPPPAGICLVISDSKQNVAIARSPPDSHRDANSGVWTQPSSEVCIIL
jgi:hypothetical protein